MAEHEVKYDSLDDYIMAQKHIEPTVQTKQCYQETPPSSRLEALPLEIRQNIYSYLGYPVGRHVYSDCSGGETCKFIKTHTVFHEDKRWPMKAHAEAGVFENRVKVVQLKFQREIEVKDTLMKKLLVRLEGEDKWRPLDFDVGLLSVSKQVRHELLWLLFSSNDIFFPFIVSDQTVYIK